MQPSHIFIVLLLGIGSCRTQSSKIGEGNFDKKDSTKTIIEFRPAFHERTTITIQNIEDYKSLLVLIRNNIRVDSNEDTFYLLNKRLNLKEATFIDSAINSFFAIKIPKKDPELILDGISLAFQRINGPDTNYIYMHSPDSVGRKEEFLIAINTINDLAEVASDSIVVGYLNDMLTYFGETERPKNTSIRKLRELKYGIKYSR